MNLVKVLLLSFFYLISGEDLLKTITLKQGLYNANELIAAELEVGIGIVLIEINSQRMSRNTRRCGERSASGDNRRRGRVPTQLCKGGISRNLRDTQPKERQTKCGK